MCLRVRDYADTKPWHASKAPKVARMQRSGIRGFGGAIIPDFALLHPGYAGWLRLRSVTVKKYVPPGARLRRYKTMACLKRALPRFVWKDS